MTNLILTSSPWLPLGAPNVPTPQPTNEMVVGTCQADIIEEQYVTIDYMYQIASVQEYLCMSIPREIFFYYFRQQCTRVAILVLVYTYLLPVPVYRY